MKPIILLCALLAGGCATKPKSEPLVDTHGLPLSPYCGTCSAPVSKQGMRAYCANGHLTWKHKLLGDTNHWEMIDSITNPGFPPGWTKLK